MKAFIQLLFAIGVSSTEHCDAVDANPDYAACERLFYDSYMNCIKNCSNDDPACISACTREYDQNLQKCPCREDCPSGCPCPQYDCSDQLTTTTSISTSTTTQSTSVLVLNRPLYDNVPILLDSSGLVNTNLTFTFGPGTDVNWSCSLNWRNEFYVFGGQERKSQVSKLNGCQLERIGSLPFNHDSGGCTNGNNEHIYLCFNWSARDTKKCRRTTEPLGAYETVTNSTFHHAGTRIASSDGRLDELFEKVKIFRKHNLFRRIQYWGTRSHTYRAIIAGKQYLDSGRRLSI